jgi:hypothetical protein
VRARRIEALTEAPEALRVPRSILKYSPALVLITIAIGDVQRWADPDL